MNLARSPQRTQSKIKSLVGLCAIGAIILTSGLLVQAEEPRDGVFWREMTRRDQEAYILGMMDGINAGMWHLSHAGLGRAEYETLGARVATQLNGLRSDELGAALSVFYRDEQNRKIELSAALWLVCLQLRGAPAEQIERDVAMLRARK